jgi:sugar phosphate permease
MDTSKIGVVYSYFALAGVIVVLALIPAIFIIKITPQEMNLKPFVIYANKEKTIEKVFTNETVAKPLKNAINQKTSKMLLNPVVIILIASMFLIFL